MKNIKMIIVYQEYKNHQSLVCYSEQVLGDGEIDNVSNIIYIDP